MFVSGSRFYEKEDKIDQKLTSSFWLMKDLWDILLVLEIIVPQ